MNRGPKRAKVPGGKVGEGVPPQPESSVGNDEQDRGGEGEQDHSQGAGDGAEARVQVESPKLPEYVKDLIDLATANEPVTRAPGTMDYQRQEDIFRRMGNGAPPAEIKYDEHWRGKVGGCTYRLIIWRAYSFIPERISLERLISQGSEPETWTAEVMPT